MTIKELRVLVDNLDEYIRIPGGIERLQKTILHLAVSGQLVLQDPSEGTGKDLYSQIQVEKNKLISDGKIKKQKELNVLAREDALFKVPSSWYVVNLGDIVTFKRGPFGGSLRKDMFVESGYLVYEQNHAINADFDFGRYYIDEAKYSEMIAFNVLPGDVLVSCSGTMGKVAIVPDAAAPGIINQALLLLRSMGHINKEYLKLFLQESSIQGKYFSNQKGTAIQNVSPVSVLKTIPFTLPPLLEQDRIVTKYKTVILLIEQLESKYAIEEKTRNQLTVTSLAQLAEGNKLAFDYFNEIIKTNNDVTQLDNALLSLAVHGRLVPQDMSEGSGQELHDKIKAEGAKLIRTGKLKKQKELSSFSEDEVPFKIPNSWKWVRLGDISNYGTSIKAKPSDIPNNAWVLDLEDIEKDSSVILKKVSASERSSTSDKNVFEKDDVLYGKLRPYLNKVIVAEEPGYSTSELLPIRVHANLGSPRYLMFVLKSPYFGEYVNAITYGVKMPRLGTHDGRKALIPLPPVREQERIVHKIDQVLKLTKNLRQV